MPSPDEQLIGRPKTPTEQLQTFSQQVSSKYSGKASGKFSGKFSYANSLGDGRSSRVLCFRRSSVDRFLRGLRTFVVICNLVGMLVSFVWYGKLLATNGTDMPCPASGIQTSLVSHLTTSMPLVRILISLPGALFMTVAATTRDHQLTAWFSVFVWSHQVALALNSLVICDNLRGTIWDILLVLNFMGNLIILKLTMASLFFERILCLEQSTHKDFGLRTVAKLRIPFAILGFLSAPSYLVNIPPFEYYAAALWVALLLLVMYITFQFCRIIRLSKSADLAATENAPPQRAARAHGASAALRMQCWGAVVSSYISHTYIAAQALVNFEGIADTNDGPSAEAISITFHTVATLHVLGNVFLSLALSGALSGAIRSSLDRARRHRERLQRWWQARMQWKKDQKMHKTAEGMVEWHEKSVELAGRGISLDALLKFYASLGTDSVFPGYQPGSHATRDVVKQAIIPMTASLGCACSYVMMDGKYTMPGKMVTHNWGNLFRDLIASIAADALRDDDFATIGYLLEHDIDLLLNWIKERDVGSRTYWVCAFSVNQHLSTCRDCSCGLEKVLNTTPPLLPDGRSIGCEMNKFGDMMKYLSANNPRFEEIVAVDQKFEIFTRAWCIAEIAAASTFGMPQRLKVTSADAMSANAEQLRKLKVEEMNATRPEDKEEILKSIPDKGAFNEVLQKLLFEDILPSWSSLDGGEQMTTAGGLIRIYEVAKKHGHDVWSHGA